MVQDASRRQTEPGQDGGPGTEADCAAAGQCGPQSRPGEPGDGEELRDGQTGQVKGTDGQEEKRKTNTDEPGEFP